MAKPVRIISRVYIGFDDGTVATVNDDAANSQTGLEQHEVVRYLKEIGRRVGKLGRGDWLDRLPRRRPQDIPCDSYAETVAVASRRG